MAIEKATGAALERIAAGLLAEVDRLGLLVVHDRALPCATAFVVGEPFAGSWWSHPLAHDMYNAMELLESDVATVKLVCRKQTLVARRLWPDLLTIGTGRAPWQVEGLSPAAVRLLHHCDERHGLYRVQAAERDAATALEQRLLVMSASEHTETGRHAKAVQSWASWADDHAVAARSTAEGSTSMADAQSVFGGLTLGWPKVRGKLLPWQ